MHINATLLDFGLMKVEMVSLSLQHTFLGPVSSPCREGGGGGGGGGGYRDTILIKDLDRVCQILFIFHFA